MSWDREVGAALRDAVALLRGGKTWDQAADAVGERIPSYRLRAEPDTTAGQARPNLRTRAKRNEERRRAGRPEVQLKLLPDGSPNPDYRPETILDQPYPGGSLRSLFLGGAGIGGADLEIALGQLNDALGGVHPNDTSLTLLSTGLFRRLVIDQAASNLSMKRYRYAEYQLPPYEGDDEHPAWVLTDDDVEFLRTKRNGPTGTGIAGTLPLIGFFSVVIDSDLYTSDGTVTGTGGNRAVLTDPDGRGHTGVVAWSTGFSGEGRVYRVWFGRDADRRKSRRSLCLARVHAKDAHRSLIDAIGRALHEHPEAACFEVREAAQLPGELGLRDARRRVAVADTRFKGCAEALASTGLSPAVREHLEHEAAAAERELAVAREDLDRAEAEVSAHADDVVPLGVLVDVLAAIQLPLPLDPAVARRIQVRLRDLVRDARLTIDPTTQMLRWSAILELRSEAGFILRVPIDGELPNLAKDPWLGGPPGTFWGRRCTIAEAMRAHGLGTAVTKTGRWRGHIVERSSPKPTAAAPRGRGLTP